MGITIEALNDVTDPFSVTLHMKNNRYIGCSIDISSVAVIHSLL